MGLFEPQHLILVILIALIIFGPGKMADLGGQLGRGIRDFKKAMREDETPAPTATTPAATETPHALRQAETSVVAQPIAKEAVQSH